MCKAIVFANSVDIIGQCLSAIVERLDVDAVFVPSVDHFQRASVPRTSSGPRP